MANYIDRDAAREEFDRRGLYGTELFDMFPVADVAPVLHGKWVFSRGGIDWGIGAWQCSECGFYNTILPIDNETVSVNHFAGSHYCPQCGAKMDLECESNAL